jgi:hypothetical protein
MRVLSALITPIAWLYVLIFRLREQTFGHIVKHRYLPKEILPIYLPVHMDLFWLKRGFYGRNLCLVPKGHPYSYRFQEDNKFFQTWVGTYYLNSINHNKFTTRKEKIFYLANAAIEDQDAWLKVYGFSKAHSRVTKSSMKFIGEFEVAGFKEVIYYGEMLAGVDDYLQNKGDLSLVHVFSAKVGEIYSRKKINLKLLIKDHKPSQNELVKLFGYFSVIELSENKYLLNYACGTQENKQEISHELLKVMRNLQVVKVPAKS